MERGNYSIRTPFSFQWQITGFPFSSMVVISSRPQYLNGACQPLIIFTGEEKTTLFNDLFPLKASFPISFREEGNMSSDILPEVKVSFSMVCNPLPRNSTVCRLRHSRKAPFEIVFTVEGIMTFFKEIFSFKNPAGIVLGPSPILRD